MREFLMYMALPGGPWFIGAGIYAILKKQHGWGCFLIAMGIMATVWLLGTLIVIAGNQ